jgi:hypothetical protein
MKQEVKIGQTDYTVLILIRDTAGAVKTGLTFESAGIDVCYTRVETDNDVVLTAGAPVTTTLTGVHVDWGFVEVDATNAPGLYKLDLADGVFATGAWSAVVSLIATGIDPVHIEVALIPQDPYSGVKVASQADIDFGATQKASITAAVPTTAQNADKLLGRSIIGGADGGRMVKDALKALRNKRAIAGGTLTVYEANDTDAAWTAAVVTAAGNPVSSIDPA